MGVKRASRRALLAAWLERVRPAVVTEALWDELCAALSPVSQAYLRKLLREAGARMSPMVEGVRQEDFEVLERSLLALQEVYSRALSEGQRERAKACRKLVIAAKDHARWLARRAKTEQQRAIKTEMADWILVWLENPPLFAQWLRLRKEAARRY